MRRRGERQSSNVEDRRGMSISRGTTVGGIGGLDLVAVVVISMLPGVNPTALLQIVDQNTISSTISTEQTTRPATNVKCNLFPTGTLASSLMIES